MSDSLTVHNLSHMPGLKPQFYLLTSYIFLVNLFRCSMYQFISLKMQGSILSYSVTSWEKATKSNYEIKLT